MTHAKTSTHGLDRVLPDHAANEERLLAGLTDARRSVLADTLAVLLQSLGDRQGAVPGEIATPG